MGNELKLYRSVKDILWFSFDSKTGWVMFPAEVGGWHKRQASSGFDRTDMREVPLRMGFNTGIPGAPMSSGLVQVAECKTSLRPFPVDRRHCTRKAMMETLLVLQDESSPMKLMRLKLKQYRIIEATSAEQVLRLFTENGRRVDLLLADVTLPISSGIQVALLLRLEIPGLPVILTCGNPVSSWNHRDSTDLKRLGSRSVAIILKPFQTTVLSDVIFGMTRTALPEVAGTA
jgi:CheY-like chemotaxis protein